jgi:hypothetical protein
MPLFRGCWRGGQAAACGYAISLHENSRFRLGPYEVKETVSLPRNKSEEFWVAYGVNFKGDQWLMDCWLACDPANACQGFGLKPSDQLACFHQSMGYRM